MQGYGEDDYIILDCPGQIELFTHIPVLRTLLDYMRNGGWNVCAVYCLDSHFITDSSKFISGCFQAMSAMVALEVPHLNVLTKVDLMPDKVPRPRHDKHLPPCVHALHVRGTSCLQ
jgi:GPN-loop GTPase